MRILRTWTRLVSRVFDWAIGTGLLIFAALLGVGTIIAIIADVGSRSSDSLANRIETLSESLADAAVIISAIESEVEARQELVERLLEQQKVAEAAAELNQEQVDAIAQLLRDEVDASSRRTLLLGVGATFGIGLFFFILGVMVGPRLQRWLSRKS